MEQAEYSSEVIEEATVRELDSEATVHEYDEGATVRESDEGVTVHETDAGATVRDEAVIAPPSRQIADEEQPTLYAGTTQSERTADVTVRDTPKPRVTSKGPFIKRLFTGEEVPISKPVFCIGRKEDVDYPVSHNPAISRKHAEIISRNGRHYIRDLGAKNRTYVNGKLLSAKGEKELFSGDVIKLADEDFLVKF